MAESTPIAWCDSTLNLEMGCDGCELWNGSRRSCYAGHLTEKYQGLPGWPSHFLEPRLFLDRLDSALKWRDLKGTRRERKPWLDGRPRFIFLNDMGDTFTESLSVGWLSPAIPRIAESPHEWLILTKRPKRALAFAAQVPLPDNIDIGVSVTDQATANARTSYFAGFAGHFRFISAEPLLGPIEFADLSEVEWVIVGGESGPDYREMDPAWALGIRDQCREAGVAFFFKQSSGPHSEMDPQLEGREYREAP